MTDDKTFFPRRNLSLGLAGAAFAVPIPSAAADAQAMPDSRLDQVVKRGRLLVATFNTSPPMSYVDDKGELVGFDIDIARYVANELFGDPGKIEFFPVDSSGRWPAVLSGRADFGIAFTSIYPDRALRVAFTQSYLDAGIAMLVRRDIGAKTVADLNSDKYTLANLSNPEMVDRAKRFVPKMNLLTFDVPSSMFLAVKSGQAQAMQIGRPVLDWYSKNNPEFEVLPENLGTVQNIGIYMRPGDFTWWRYLDTLVQELRTGSRYDQYTALFMKWFGKAPPPQRFYG